MAFRSRLNWLRDYWYLAAAACLGLAAAAAVYAHLTAVNRIAPVLVAATDIPAGARVEDGMVRVSHLPAPAIHPHALTGAAQARGRVARQAIVRGEQILAERLAGGPDAAAVSLEDGERALFVPLGPDRAYPASFLHPGERVDLILVADPGAGEDGLARLLLAGVKVLAVHAERQGAFGRDEAIQGVTVAVDAAQAERLAFAVEQGRIHILAGGTPGDRGAGIGVTWDNLFAGDGAAAGMDPSHDRGGGAPDSPPAEKAGEEEGLPR